MKINNLILEAPALTDEVTSYLDDPIKNQRRLEKLSTAHKEHLFDVNKNTHVFKIHTDNEEIYVAIDSIDMKIVYYMSYEFDKHRLLGLFVNQSFVWVDKTYPNAKGLPKKIFFDYLLKEHNIVITDSIQTWDGRDFWLRRLLDAFQKHLYVYYIDLESDHIEPVHQYMAIHKLDTKYHIWAKQAFSKRLLISTTKLL
jgi:hypothetical protein